MIKTNKHHPTGHLLDIKRYLLNTYIPKMPWQKPIYTKVENLYIRITLAITVTQNTTAVAIGTLDVFYSIVEHKEVLTISSLQRGGTGV